MCVLFGHANTPLFGFSWLPATTAVEVFFVISGFYMQMVLSEKYTTSKLGKNFYKIFYFARYFRLFPAYVVALGLSILAGLFAYHLVKVPPISIWLAIFNLDHTLPNIIFSIATILSNLTMFFQDFSLVLAIRDGSAVFTLDRNLTDFYVPSALAIQPAWSLSVELVFYLIAPFILNWPLRRLALLFVLALMIKICAVYLLSSDLPYRLFPFVIVHFLAGSLAYKFRYWLKYPSYISYVLLFMIVLVIPYFLKGALLSFVCLGLTAFAVPIAFCATKNFRWDNFIGELSYPFYILHSLCLSMVTFIFKRLNIGDGSGKVLITLFVTLVLSFFVIAFEKKYLEPWRQNLSRKRS